MKLVLIGIQGAGKSTQGNMLSKYLKLPYLSTGHIFREIAKEKTAMGRYVKETINSGILISDEKTIPIVNQYLSRPEYQKGYILDGFPRNLFQAKKFKNHVDKVIFINVPDRDALWRIAFRNDNSRSDETLPGIKKRIELFYKVTKPVVEYYKKQNKLIAVDGTKSIEEVNKQILKSLGKERIKNHIREWEQKKKIIVGIVGLYGSGKSEAGKFFSEKKIPVIHFGSIINEMVDKSGQKHDENIHGRLRAEIREKYGMAAMAITNEEKIVTFLKKNQLVVIEDMMSYEEYVYLTKKFAAAKVTILTLWSPKEVRYERVKKRKYRNNFNREERDLAEITKQNSGATIAFSDYLVVNDGTLADFHSRLEAVYRAIYFS